MSRAIVRALLALPIVLVLLCGVASVRAWARQGHDLIVPGAQQVRIEHTGMFKVQASYQLRAGQNTQDALQFLRARGWQRLRAPGGEHGVFMLVRPNWPGQTRELLILTVSASDPRRLELQYGRCFKAAWLSCI